MVLFGKDPIGSKDEAREDCSYTRMLSDLYHRARKQLLVTAKP